MRIILDAKYKKSELNTVMTKTFQHIITAERYRLLNTLKKFEDLSGGMLGTWNTTPLDLGLKDNSMPVCSRPYPVPR